MIWLSVVGIAQSAPPVLPYAFEERAVRGAVHVLPVIDLVDPLPVETTAFVGEAVPWVREEIRGERVASLALVGHELALAMPGAIHAAVGREWKGVFHRGRFPVSGRAQVRRGLAETGVLDRNLGRVAGRMRGDASLFTWVSRIAGRPLTAEAFPGEFVSTTIGPVVVDHLDEPYFVEVDLGLALVTHDGEVVLRYEDRLAGVLSEEDSPTQLATRLASQMAAELVSVWVVTPPEVE